MSFILLLLIPLVLSKWERPVMVVPYAYTSRAIFTDSVSGVSTVVWCNHPRRNLHFRQLHPNGTVTFEKTLMLEHPCKLGYALDGPHDGKTLYLLYQGTRKRDYDRRVCRYNANNCEDVFFAESKNGGETWSEPVAVPREDMGDKTERQFAKLLVAKTGHVWIFYRMAGFYDAPYAYVMRAPGSSAFGMETVLPIRVDTSAVVYGENDGKSSVSIYYNNHDSLSRYKYYTTDNGATWLGPEQIVYCESDSNVLSRYPFNSPRVPSLFFVECRNSSYRYWLKRTYDLGKTWEPVSKSIDESSGMYTFASDGKGGGVVAYGTITVHYMDVKGNAFKEMERPPTPAMQRSIELTSSYALKKFWFWYEVYEPQIHCFSTWAVSADMEINK